jgi:protein-S-isoprenylcysteine O-methyltransferase Ste14
MGETNRPGKGPGMWESMGDIAFAHRIGVSRVFVASLFLLYVLSGSMYEGTLFSSVVFVLGVMLVGVATVGRIWCSVYISGYKDSVLITTGPYSLCRNPLYFFSLLGAVGLGLTTETFAIAVAFAVGYTIGYPGVIRREERSLRQRFGSKFEDYCARTPRFVPNVFKFSEPTTYEIRSKPFRRALGDVVWFVWIIGFMELVETLHELQVIQPLFRLP